MERATEELIAEYFARGNKITTVQKSPRSAALDLGQRFYCHGAPCSKCSTTNRYAKTGVCVECARARREANRADAISRSNKWRNDNPNGRRESRRYRKEKNLFENAAMIAASRKEAVLESIRKREIRIEHRKSQDEIERRRLLNMAWVNNNYERRLEIARHSAAVRRARKLSANGSYTQHEARDLFNKQHGRCANCNVRLKMKTAHLDHIFPISNGGANDIANLQWLCRACNCRKSAKDPFVWAAENNRLL